MAGSGRTEELGTECHSVAVSISAEAENSNYWNGKEKSYTKLQFNALLLTRHFFVSIRRPFW